MPTLNTVLGASCMGMRDPPPLPWLAWGVGSFVVGFVYTFGIALAPDFAYVILFLPMVFVIAFRPRGLFGRLTV